ncbi:MAG: hypothetical protein RI897_148 [Verrucomicrobiota bacterium]
MGLLVRPSPARRAGTKEEGPWGLEPFEFAECEELDGDDGGEDGKEGGEAVGGVGAGYAAEVDTEEAGEEAQGQEERGDD